MHIGLLAADLSYRHGWAHYSLSVARALLRAGARLTLVVPRHTAATDMLTADMLTDAAVTVLPMLPTVDPLERGMLARQMMLVPRLRRALAGCDAVHAAVELYAPAAAAVHDERPFVITGHGTYVRLPDRPVPAGTVYRWAFQQAIMACVSAYTAAEAQRVLPGLRTVVVPNGVEAERFAAVQKITHPRPTVISVGAVKARKGTLPLVRAIALLRERLPAVRCFIVGSLTAEPDYTRAVQAEIDRLALNEAITLTGQIGHDEVLALYGGADVFALPSVNVEGRFEGYGLALLEAGAAGLPVIGSRDCGAETAVEEGVTGLLVRQHDAEPALADALYTLLTDRALAGRMGAAGKARAHAHTWDHHAGALLTLYAGGITP